MENKEGEIDEYEKIVNFYFDNKSTTIFGNTSAKHAVFVMKKLLEVAKKDVKILTGTCAYCDALKDELLTAAKRIKMKMVLLEF